MLSMPATPYNAPAFQKEFHEKMRALISVMFEDKVSYDGPYKPEDERAKVLSDKTKEKIKSEGEKYLDTLFGVCCTEQEFQMLSELLEAANRENTPPLTKEQAEVLRKFGQNLLCPFLEGKDTMGCVFDLFVGLHDNVSKEKLGASGVKKLNTVPQLMVYAVTQNPDFLVSLPYFVIDKWSVEKKRVIDFFLIVEGFAESIKMPDSIKSKLESMKFFEVSGCSRINGVEETTYELTAERYTALYLEGQKNVAEYARKFSGVSPALMTDANLVITEILLGKEGKTAQPTEVQIAGATPTLDEIVKKYPNKKERAEKAQEIYFECRGKLISVFNCFVSDSDIDFAPFFENSGGKTINDKQYEILKSFCSLDAKAIREMAIKLFTPICFEAHPGSVDAGDAVINRSFWFFQLLLLLKQLEGFRGAASVDDKYKLEDPNFSCIFGGIFIALSENLDVVFHNQFPEECFFLLNEACSDTSKLMASGMRESFGDRTPLERIVSAGKVLESAFGKKEKELDGSQEEMQKELNAIFARGMVLANKQEHHYYKRQEKKSFNELLLDNLIALPIVGRLFAPFHMDAKPNAVGLFQRVLNAVLIGLSTLLTGIVMVPYLLIKTNNQLKDIKSKCDQASSVQEDVPTGANIDAKNDDKTVPDASNARTASPAADVSTRLTAQQKPR